VVNGETFGALERTVLAQSAVALAHVWSDSLLVYIGPRKRCGGTKFILMESQRVPRLSSGFRDRSDQLR
jgi:hypothetical protein